MNNNQSDKQLGVYIVGTILAALIAVAFWQSPAFGAGIGWIAFGTIIFAFLIGNYFLFRYDLVREIAVGYGIISLITAFYGSFVTFQVIPATVYAVVIALAILGIYLSSEEPQTPARHPVL